MTDQCLPGILQVLRHNKELHTLEYVNTIHTIHISSISSELLSIQEAVMQQSFQLTKYSFELSIFRLGEQITSTGLSKLDTALYGSKLQNIL